MPKRMNRDQINARIEHLRRLPPTPMRAREISALERMLDSDVNLDRPPATPKATAPRVKIAPEVKSRKETAPTNPFRKVEKDGDHRRIIIKKQYGTQQSEKDEDEEVRKEGKQRLSDIQATLGLKFRGFS